MESFEKLNRKKIEEISSAETVADFLEYDESGKITAIREFFLNELNIDPSDLILISSENLKSLCESVLGDTEISSASDEARTELSARFNNLINLIKSGEI